nr:dihydrodipicolinate synthase family protein [Candidatus Sigynarchaeota archaeon]
MAHKFDGIVVPVLTMFQPDYSVNIDAQILVTRHAIANGADQLFLLGSTGEGQFIQAHHPGERAKILLAARRAMDIEKKRIPVMIGIFGDTPAGVLASLDEILHDERETVGSGFIDGVVISPPLQRHVPDQQDLLVYLDEIIGNIRLPVFVYNNTSRFGNNTILPPIYHSLLKKHDHLLGIKDSDKEVHRKKEIIQMLSRETPDVSFYTGSEGDFFECLSAMEPSRASTVGCIPSISNVLNIPPKMRATYLSGYMSLAKSMQDTLNAIRTKFYHGTSAGKAQRGLKVALKRLYKDKDSLHGDVILSPEYARDIERTFAEEIDRAIADAISGGFIDKLAA